MSIDVKVSKQPQPKSLENTSLEQTIQQETSSYDAMKPTRMDSFREWGKDTWVWQYRKKAAETGLILAGVKAPIEVAFLENVDLVDHFTMTAGLYAGYMIVGPAMLKLFSQPVRKSKVKVAGVAVPYWLRYGGRQVGVALGALALKVGIYTHYLDNDFLNATEAGLGVAVATAAISMITPSYEQKKRAKRFLMATATAGLVSAYSLVPLFKSFDDEGQKIENDVKLYKDNDSFIPRTANKDISTTFLPNYEVI